MSAGRDNSTSRQFRALKRNFVSLAGLCFISAFTSRYWSWKTRGNLNVLADALWEALYMQALSSENFTGVSDVVGRDRMDGQSTQHATKERDEFRS